MRATLASLKPSAPETRRVGVAAALRNCCADARGCESVLAAVGSGNAAAVAAEASVAGFAKVGASGATEGGLEVVRALLAPVSGGTGGAGVGKERCDAVRQSCAEAVACLADCEGGRAALVQCDAPRLMRLGYADEPRRDGGGDGDRRREVPSVRDGAGGAATRGRTAPGGGGGRGEDDVEEIQRAEAFMTPEVD